MDATIDPTAIPDALTADQLEAWILFGILVANKEAESTRHKLQILMGTLAPEGSPFERVRKAHDAGTLMTALRTVRVGQYGRIYRAFTEVIKLQLNPISVAAFESIHGIGPKTARMIVLYAVPDMEVVPLDTHVLKYLRKLGYEGVPQNTPSAGPSYARWEKTFIEEAKKAGMTVKQFDTYVWKMYAKSTAGERG